jgi:hypothetical protein
MPKPSLTVRRVSAIVRDYFDEVKRSRFIFDIRSVSSDGVWEVLCEVSNSFDEKPRVYRVVVDENGEISDLRETGSVDC